VDWETVTSGPGDATQTVLLLPGGLHSARSYRSLMAQPALAAVRLVAATLPGHAGTPPPADYSIEAYAQLTARLANDLGCHAVLGFSIGASVAAEMVASGGFRGPTVLLGVSLSPRDEPVLLRTIDRIGGVLRTAPGTALRAFAGLGTRHARLPADARAELVADLRRNDRAVVGPVLHGYLDYLGRHDDPAARLCEAGVPIWVVHAARGDGGLTAAERRTLASCPRVTVVTIPATSYFLPNEEPQRVAALLCDALAFVG
jgi:pimeloyl-ACP methyl ester carboxylesterase